jgi:WhiB family redox-sensing transcriptional regulator
MTHTHPADVIAWDQRAICATEDPERWYPLGYGAAYTDDIEAARTLCRRCPVIAECLTDAMEDEGSRPGPGRDGIRGALTPDERAALRRRNDRARKVAADTDDAPDPVVVERAIDGHAGKVTPAERTEAVRIMACRGWSDLEMAARLRIALRSVQRIRAAYGIESRWVA